MPASAGERNLKF